MGSWFCQVVDTWMVLAGRVSDGQVGLTVSDVIDSWLKLRQWALQLAGDQPG